MHHYPIFGIRCQPPVQAPTFTGPDFDPTQDPIYTAAIAADQAAYDSAVASSNSDYDTSVKDAADAENSSVAAAKTTEQEAFGKKKWDILLLE